MSRIIFVPICEECGYEFKELNVDFDIENSFKVICPKCGSGLNNITIANIKDMVKGQCFIYNKKEFYQGEII